MVKHKRTTVVSWDRFDRDTRRLAGKIEAARVRPDFILGVNRGGAVTAVLLSHLLDVRDMLTFSIQMTVDARPNAERRPARIVGAEILLRLAGRRVLLVDDAIGSGRTYEEARRVLAPVAVKSLHTAATIWNRELHAECPADFHGGTTPGWVLFPWEPRLALDGQ